MVPFEVPLEPQSKLDIRAIIRPISEVPTVIGTGEVILVHHGLVELRLFITANTVFTSSAKSKMIDLTGNFSWQTCDDEVCDIPRHTRFRISVPIEIFVVPDFITKRGNSRVCAMNGVRHFKKCVVT
ncbi:MAG: hypothetical protein ACI8W1_002298 [Candidatus Azotimanducaceae bacterium]|jgi:hypothetical protein